MLFTNTIVGLAAVATVAAQGATPEPFVVTSSPFKVSVGKDGLTYTPSNIIAEIGTRLEFEFFPKNHTVTQSSFNEPCQPLAAGGFFSGFVPTRDGPSPTTFTIIVEDKKPIWFYCSQTVGAHCQKGMVGAVNAPREGNTLGAFISLAAKAGNSTAPAGGPTGGEIKTGDGNGEAPPSSSSPPSSSAPPAVTSAQSTSAIVTTYTSESTTYASTIGSSTIYPTGAVAPTGNSPPSPSSSPIVPTNGASGLSANAFGAGAVIFGAMAML